MTDLRDFEAGLDHVPWFERVGKPIEQPVPRLGSWEDWAGEYAESVDVIGDQLSNLREELLGPSAEPGSEERQALEDLFDRVIDHVREAAAKNLPCDPRGDSEHPARFAASQAGWTAALVALCLAMGRAVPGALAKQWEWFRRGHWPAEVVLDEDGGVSEDADQLTYRVF